MAKKRESIKVVYKKLGKRNEWGNADIDKKIIEIDPRAVGRKKIEILVHEALHIMLSIIDEDAIKLAGAAVTKVLWDEGVRPTDSADHQKLQDEIP